MFFRHKHCPTCRGGQEFRRLDEAEKAAVRADRGERHFVDHYWRCTAPGCRWYQRWSSRADGGLLPEELRMRAAPE
jgi:hypothetical protein